jgi:hypothetical protein
MTGKLSPSFVLLVIAAVLAAAGVWVAMRFQEFEKWPKTIATVERIELTPSSKNQPSKKYTLAFSYDVDGNIFTSETVVTGKRAWESVRPGSKIDVAYDPKDHGNIYVFASGGGNLHRLFFYAGSLFALVAVTLIVVKKLRSAS